MYNEDFNNQNNYYGSQGNYSENQVNLGKEQSGTGYNGEPEIVVTPNGERVPYMATKWNWGAAFAILQFAIFNKAWLCLLSLIPVLNMFWWVICGLKGAQWAWESGLYNSPDSFNTSMKNWNRVGIVTLVICITVFIIYIAIVVFMFIAFGSMAVLAESMGS